MSGLADNDKKRLTSVIHEIDGFVSETWTSMCTHLTVANGTLTEKVAFAMLSLKPIVTTEYWAAVKESVNSSSELPSTDDYVPSVGEKFLHRNDMPFLPNKNRQELFKGLIFIFFTRHQYKRFGKLIAMGGGKALLYGTKKLTIAQLCLPNVVLIQYVNDINSQATQTFVPEYDTIYEAVQQKQRRIIPDVEILLGILDCSVKEYCNPTYKFGDLLKRKNFAVLQETVIVPDSQDLRSKSCEQMQKASDLVKPIKPKSELEANMKIIPETLEYSIQVNVEDESCNTAEINSMINTHKRYIPETQDSFHSDCYLGIKKVCHDSNIMYNHSKQVEFRESLDFPDESEQIENSNIIPAKSIFSIKENNEPEKLVERDKYFAPEECASMKDLSMKPESVFRARESSESFHSDKDSSGSRCLTKPASILAMIIPETPTETNESEYVDIRTESELIEECHVKQLNQCDIKLPNTIKKQGGNNIMFNGCNLSENGFVSTSKQRLSCEKPELGNLTSPKIIANQILRNVPGARKMIPIKGIDDLELPQNLDKFVTKSDKNVNKCNESTLEIPQSKNSGGNNEEIRKSALVDDDFVKCKKKTRLDSANSSDLIEPEQNTSANITGRDPVCKTSFTSSFLRINLNSKRFKKVYNKFPAKRIQLSDMKVWKNDLF